MTALLKPNSMWQIDLTDQMLPIKMNGDSDGALFRRIPAIQIQSHVNGIAHCWDVY